MSYNRFDHEQQLLKCWNVTDDLQVVLETIEKSNIPAKDMDQLSNMLIGMIALYDQKFDKLFGMFEHSIKEHATLKSSSDVQNNK